MRLLFLPLAILIAMSQAQAQSGPPDLILLNGNIYTGAIQKASPPYVDVLPRVQALAIRGDRIIASGTNVEIKKLKQKHTQVIDLAGRFVMPGFNDAHQHFAAGALEELRVNLLGVTSLQDMQARVAEHAKQLAPNEWIVGRGWDQTLWSDKHLPTRQDLDQVTGNHPAVLTRVDGHIAVANTAALKAAGISRETPDPEGGKIDHDANGEPTGVVRETARDQLLLKVPPPSLALRRRAIELGMKEAAEWGITSVQDSISNDQDPTEWDYFLTYEQLELENKLTVRVSEWLPFRASIELLQSHRAHHAHSDLMLHTAMLKAYLDGSLGSRTAALNAPYSDDPGNKGVLHWNADELRNLAQERVAAGFQLGFHAIGDAALDLALNTFSDAQQWNQRRQVTGQATSEIRDFRFRVEHVQVASPVQISRMAAMSVIASVQPCHLLTDMNWAEARLGPERAKNSYPWANLLHAGVKLAFGTDYQVEPMDPFRGLYAAVTRKNEAGSSEYYPEQKLTIDQAIAAYTSGSAYAEFTERDKGTLAPGMLADFVVLDRDITHIPPPEVLHAHVLRTVLGGKTVFESH